MPETLNSLIAQSIDKHLILVSDNNSTDETADIVKSYAKANNKKSSLCNIELVKQDENLGMVGNWNFLLSQVKSPTFTLISHDDLLADKDCLKKSIRTLEQNPDVAAVFGDTIYIDTKSNQFSQKHYNRSGLFDGSDVAKESCVYLRNLFGLPIAIKTAHAQNIHFDPAIKYAADLDFAIQLAMSGLQVHHIPEFMFCYRVHAANNTTALLRYNKSDFSHIMKKHQIDLSKFEKVQHTIFSVTTPVLRQMFIKLMVLISRIKNLF